MFASIFDVRTQWLLEFVILDTKPTLADVEKWRHYNCHLNSSTPPSRHHSHIHPNYTLPLLLFQPQKRNGVLPDANDHPLKHKYHKTINFRNNRTNIFSSLTNKTAWSLLNSFGTKWTRHMRFITITFNRGVIGAIKRFVGSTTIHTFRIHIAGTLITTNS